MAKNPNSPLNRIRQYCIQCVGNARRVKECPAEECKLWDFRMGKNPFLKAEMTDEQRVALAERLRRAREMKK